LNALTDTQARPWYEHECFGGRAEQFPVRDESFRHGYADMEMQA
jgi:hypothetical protein